MSSNSYSPVPPPVFTGENYQLWAVKMTAYLQAWDLWEAVKEDLVVPPITDNSTVQQIKIHYEKQSKLYKAKTCLFSAVSESLFTRIMNLETAFKIWEYLKQEFQGNARTKSMRILNLKREFELQKMKDSETIKEYAEKLFELVNKLRLIGEQMPDSRVVEKLLVTLPERFEAKISALEESKDLSTITLAELLSALEAHEQRKLIRDEANLEGAMQAQLQIQSSQILGRKNKDWHKNKGNFSNRAGNDGTPRVTGTTRNDVGNKGIMYAPCQHCGRTNHPSFRCWSGPDVKCNKCNKMGHVERICRNKEKYVNEAQVVNQEEEKEEEDEQLFVASCYANINQSETWLVDSGCTNHMTNNVELFRELDQKSRSKVRVGNGQYISVKGKGSIAIETLSGTKIINDVMYVPDIDQNLLSVGQLLEKGFKVHFEDKMCVIKDATGVKLFSVQMKGKSFQLDLLEKEQSVYQASMKTTDIWHKRLGHCHHSAILKLQKFDMVKDLDPLNESISNCKTCQFGKQTRLPFPKKSWRATEKLQLVHTDLGGPFSTPSLRGSRYYIAFIDDKTRMTWIYFLRFKFEVAGVFWKFKIWVENQSRCTMMMLRSDNGTEYTSNKFNKFCEAAGIEHQLTAPYTPQQNGVSERKNRTIGEMTRCLLHEKNLPKSFWAEAANTAVFLLNILPTKALENQTPYESWYGKKPTFCDLKIFGCLCFSHIPSVRRDKLDKKSDIGIFIGYSGPAKAYRIYQPPTNKIIISRDVVFMEEEQWDWNASENDQLSHNFRLNENDIDDYPVRGTRLLTDIYETCNIALLEPANVNA